MARGGPRNRSGPQANPSSARSEKRGVSLTALPAKGYTGRVPKFPLPPRRLYFFAPDGDGGKVRMLDEAATDEAKKREAELWKWAWRTPQAQAWAQPSESWRLHTIAMWVRTYVLCESAEATAADKGSLHRFADQIGMTPAGLKENGWVIVADEVGAKRATKAAAPKPKTERRLRAVES